MVYAQKVKMTEKLYIYILKYNKGIFETADYKFLEL